MAIVDPLLQDLGAERAPADHHPLRVSRMDTIMSAGLALEAIRTANLTEVEEPHTIKGPIQ